VTAADSAATTGAAPDTATPTASAGPPPSRPPRASRQARRERRSRDRRPARLIETAGPDPATPLAEVRLVVGTIVGTHGVRGELKVLLTTDDPEHLRTIKRVYVGDEPTPRRVLSLRFHDRFALMRVKGIPTPEAGAEFRGRQLRIAGTDARPLAPGEFYLYQLIGLSVVNEAGQPLGTVTDIMETGANDVLVVAPPDGGKDELYPNHPDVVLDVDPEAGRLVVRPLVYLE
jgi:16S rRNA processing protein RimM